MKRPLGVLVLVIFFSTAAVTRAIRLVFVPGVPPLAIATCGFELLLAIGIFQLARWGWVLLLLSSFVNAIFAGYLTAKAFYLRESLSFAWREALNGMILNLMIVVYLLDGHVRRSFWGSSRGRESEQP